MAFLGQEDPLWELMERIVAELGLSLYDAERVAGSGLRITIARGEGVDADGSAENSNDAASGDEVREANVGFSRGGVSSGDCSKVCRRLMVQFEAEGSEYGLSNEPQIEVSSPGVNRALRRPEHFVDAVGERVKVVPDGALEGGSAGKKSHGSYLGILQSFSEAELVIVEEKSNELVKIPFGQVKKASVAFKF